MVSILQFWTDEELIKDGEIFGGWVHPVSALAEYVMETINPHLEETQKVTWEKVVHQTPWMKKQLVNTTVLRSGGSGNNLSQLRVNPSSWRWPWKIATTGNWKN